MEKRVLIFLILCSVHFFRFIFIPEAVLYGTDILSLGYLLFIFFSSKKPAKYKRIIVLFLFGVVLSAFSAYISWNQSLLDSFTAVRELFFILIYYYVEEKEIPIEYLEKIILRFAVFFSLIYIISVVIYPTAIVRAILSSEDRGTIRMRLEGSGFMMLGYFLVVNRYFVNKKLINAALSFFFLFVLFLHGFRTFIAVAALLTMILYFKLNNVNAKNILVLLLGFITLLLFAQIPIIARIIDKFSSVTESDASSGGDYIRLQEFDFYAYHFSSGWYSYIFGNGMPRGDNDYTAFYTRITENRKLFFVDLGLFGFYIIYGVMATYALIKYVISVIMAKTNLAYRYLNYYFGYLLLVSITTLELYRSGMFGVEALVLYMSVKAVEIAKNQV